MGWAISVGRIAGIELRIHLTFFLLLAWIAAMLWASRGPAAALDGLLFVIVLFACVVLHELGHALVARRFGIGTKDILLLPIGGLASLDKMPEDPSQEVLVALAGPAVNLVISGILIGALGGRLEPLDIDAFGTGVREFINRIATVNIVLAVFNLLPAFPMDGGRVLRALLGFRMSRARATQIAATVGQALAIVFAFIGLMGNPVLVLIAIFVFFAANAESYSATMHDFARGRPVGEALITEFQSLSPGDTLDAAAKLLLATTQREFPIVSADGRLIGFVTRERLVEDLGVRSAGATVDRIIDPNIPALKDSASLEAAVTILEQKAAPAVAVLNAQHQFVGYVTLENLAEFSCFAARSAVSGCCSHRDARVPQHAEARPSNRWAIVPSILEFGDDTGMIRSSRAVDASISYGLITNGLIEDEDLLEPPIDRSTA